MRIQSDSLLGIFARPAKSFSVSMKPSSAMPANTAERSAQAGEKFASSLIAWSA